MTALAVLVVISPWAGVDFAVIFIAPLVFLATSIEGSNLLRPHVRAVYAGVAVLAAAHVVAALLLNSNWFPAAAFAFFWVGTAMRVRRFIGAG